uniref:Zinc finger, CCHC-type n=1 Tax=Tanacetum cinerariifolium TaxID=118510 RepID=A0A6L2K0L7_TANCI|nr:zinc finger, CCHC-type [Tanacetum cinerariifolium]
MRVSSVWATRFATTNFLAFKFVNDKVAAVAQRRLEDKQPEEKKNTDCLVKEQENKHLGVKAGANITVTGVPGQEGNVAEKKKIKESMKTNLRKLLMYKAWLTRRSPVRGEPVVKGDNGGACGGGAMALLGLCAVVAVVVEVVISGVVVIGLACNKSIFLEPNKRGHTTTAIMCQSLEDNNEDNKDSSWTDWAKGKVAGVFKGDQVKETARHTANHVGDAASDAISEKAIEEEEAAAQEAKKLSEET